MTRISRYKLSERKMNFARYYFDFERIYTRSQAGNAYRCGLLAKYSDSYARKILSYMDWRELELLVKMSEKDNQC